MSLYLDTSVVLKLIFQEPESQSVFDIIDKEQELIVSSLTRLETLIGINARRQSGLIRPLNVQKKISLLERFLSSTPFTFMQCPLDIFTVAEQQLSTGYCPTLDRLHLATMHSLGIQRIFTNDMLQAKAATSLGFSARTPQL